MSDERKHICDYHDPFGDSNSSTYIVACVVELRVSARNEEEALRKASLDLFDGAVIRDIVNVSFRVEDKPGGCCRDGVYGDWRDRPGNYGE